MAFASYFMVVALLLMQPDIGMTLLITSIFVLQLFLAGLPWMLVGVAGVGGVCALFVLYFTYPHFRARVDQFLYGSDETSFQINKAMLAFQNGNLARREATAILSDNSEAIGMTALSQIPTLLVWFLSFRLTGNPYL